MSNNPARIGDNERSEALKALGVHYAEGRLRLEEFEQRSEEALQAYTVDELDQVFADLPLPNYESAIEPYQPPASPAVKQRQWAQRTDPSTNRSMMDSKRNRIMVALWTLAAIWIPFSPIFLAGLLGIHNALIPIIMFLPLVLMVVLSILVGFNHKTYKHSRRQYRDRYDDDDWDDDDDDDDDDDWDDDDDDDWDDDDDDWDDDKRRRKTRRHRRHRRD